ncbi:MAG: winged helix-turn-helix domain-containing protein [Candidatus Bathyarchaeales archaeon]
MAADLQNLHRILKDHTRREIIRYLYDKGSLSYTELMKILSIKNTGRLNYHLKVLNDLVKRAEDGKYGLTEKGMVAASLLEKFQGKTTGALRLKEKEMSSYKRIFSLKAKKPIGIPKKFLLGAILVFLICLSIITIISLTRSIYEAPPIQWQKFYSGISGNFIISTSDGGYLVLGANASIQNTDTWPNYVNYTSLLIKTNSSGDVIWIKTYQIQDAETMITRVIRTIDGGYALAGVTLAKTIFPEVDLENATQFGIATRQFCLIKIDTFGDVQWTRTYVHGRESVNGGEAYVAGHDLTSIIQTADGGYALVGTYWFAPPTDQHIWFVKADANGNLQCNKTVSPGQLGNFASSLFQTNDGGYIIMATKTTHGPSPASFELIKLDSEGNVQWYETYGGECAYYSAKCYSGTVARDGGYILAGFVSSENGTPPLGWLVKTDSHGKMLWNRIYGQNNSIILAITQTSDGGYIFAGTTGGDGAIGGNNAWVVKIDEVGNMEWETSIGVNFVYGINTPSAILEANDGGYVFTGTYNGTYNVGYQKLWLVKIAVTRIFHPYVWLLIQTTTIIVCVVAEAAIIAVAIKKRKHSAT